jgi:hypothetical protein
LQRLQIWAQKRSTARGRGGARATARCPGCGCHVGPSEAPIHSTHLHGGRTWRAPER